MVLGVTLEDITKDFRGFWRKLTNEDQLRWVMLKIVFVEEWVGLLAEYAACDQFCHYVIER